ncbi:bifunctional diguanylate cyclase/phosphodiesterase [Tolumonas lignilytica]|uniref:bifunctional diguanylate cyclase/phosphodiesterase n=1 Tax=Tolumonas lignilytica TaxID=1283284 RepID=UPI000465C0C5|nr:LapD/MoxY N-terminal periplasmic domain-containing protein [Tolumonas lignilytica]
MTLYKQILAFVICLFAGLLIIAYAVQFQSTRDYLAEQQRISVINTANSVGLALTPYLETGDKVGAESVINAAFDGGYYQKIHLDLLASKQTIEKTNQTDIEGVPHWFTQLNLFKSESYETVLTSGWLQLGRLEVKGHPGDAYFQFWRAMSNLFWAYISCFIVVSILIVAALRILLRPLESIRRQAVEIEKHHFNQSIPLPKTLELRQVVQSINALTIKLAKQFKEEAVAADLLRERAFRDAVSGLGNRAYFIGQINAWIAEHGTGGVMLIAVDALDDIYRHDGYSARDKMVKQIANVLNTKLAVYEGGSVARISATEYAVLLPGLSSDELLEAANILNDAIANLIVNPLDTDSAFSVIGIAVRNKDEDLSALLTKADSALRRARNERLGAVTIEQADTADILGRLAWKDIILNSLEHDQFDFRVQPVTMLSGQNNLPAELFSGIKYQGQRFSAAQFMSAVEMFKLGEKLDRYVLEQSLVILKDNPDLSLSINLTIGSISSSSFHSFLKEFFVTNNLFISRIALEIPENAILQHKESVKNLNGLCAEFKVMWGIDQFGRHFQSLEYLTEFTPAYVKVDQGYMSVITKDENAQSVLAAVCRTAHNAGAVTIVTRVEDQKQVELITQLFVDGYQGIVQPAREI